MEVEFAVIWCSAYGPLLLCMIGIDLWSLMDRGMMLCRKSRETVNGMKWRGDGEDAGQAPPAVYDNIPDLETPLCWKPGC